MEFIETPTFTRQIVALLPDEAYRGLQNLILENPERGDLIVGGGGLRKLRYALPGRGKSGGMRTIYYWRHDAHQVLMLVAYPKSRQDTLSDAELAILRRLIEEI
jgi:Protein of unknown function (DUF1044).